MARAQSYRQVRMSIPENDVSVLRWLEAQSNMTLSIRLAIRQAITKYGYVDLSCLDIDKGPGRPRETEYQEPVPEARPQAPAAQPAPARPQPMAGRSDIRDPRLADILK